MWGEGTLLLLPLSMASWSAHEQGAGINVEPGLDSRLIDLHAKCLPLCICLISFKLDFLEGYRDGQAFANNVKVNWTAAGWRKIP